MVPVRAVPFGAAIIGCTFTPQFPNSTRVPLLSLPILQIHGTHDIDLPFSMGHKLAQLTQAAGTSSAFTFLPLPGYGHLLGVRYPGLYESVLDTIRASPAETSVMSSPTLASADEEEGLRK